MSSETHEVIQHAVTPGSFLVDTFPIRKMRRFLKSSLILTSSHSSQIRPFMVPWRRLQETGQGSTSPR
jgi:hypothetical protein